MVHIEPKREHAAAGPDTGNGELLLPHAFRIAGASWYSGLSRSTLYKLAKDGRLQMVRVAGRTLILRSELERLLDEAR